MVINIGKFSGKTTESVLIKEPDYVQWTLDQNNAKDALQVIRKDFIRLMEIFDGKPIKKKCYKCKEPAQKISFYQGNISPYFWCGTCDPYCQGALSGKLSIITKYRQALSFVSSTCQGRKSDYKSIIRELAIAKGMPDRITGIEAQSFFE